MNREDVELDAKKAQQRLRKEINQKDNIAKNLGTVCFQMF